MKEILKKVLRAIFEFGQRLGLNILPKHFYSQIPDIAFLKSEQFWRKPCSMHGILGADIEAQVAFVKDCCPEALSRTLRSLDIYRAANAENGTREGYGPIEAELLYAFIARHRPAKVLQIGCGVSTSIILRAAGEVGYRPEVVCVEPYPSEFLQKAHGDGRIRLVPEKAQKVGLEELTALAPGDLFFVDSTHTVTAGSEVNRIILEVLPRLGPDVWVHFHDIYFPYDYSRNLLDKDLFFWSETTLLYAYLLRNPGIKIAAAMSMLHYQAAAELARLFPDYDPQVDLDGLWVGTGRHFPSSVYLKTL